MRILKDYNSFDLIECTFCGNDFSKDKIIMRQLVRVDELGKPYILIVNICESCLEIIGTKAIEIIE